MNNYFSNVTKNGSLSSIFIWSTILASIILWIDYRNIPSRFLPLKESKFIFIFSLILFLLMLSLMAKLHLFESIKIWTITIVDRFLLVTFVSLVICTVSYLVGFPSDLQHRFYIFIVLGLSIILLFCRIYFFTRGKQPANEIESNVFDLKEILYGNINELESKPLYINESPVDYDLLQRESIINQVYDTLIKSNPKEKFVISLEGSWGSGKTTIIKNIKNRIYNETKNVIVIDKFDPWVFLDQESLLEYMLDILLDKSGVKFSPINTNRFIDQVKVAVFGSRNRSWLASFFGSGENIQQTKEMINQYLRNSGKKVIFIIDNIDRAENENVLLIFKLISNVFDFKRVTYLLSFDREQVDRIFKKENIDPGYIKKMIQMEVSIPIIEQDVLNNLYKETILKIIEHYNVDKLHENEYNFILNALINSNIDMRDFKRFINSAVIPSVLNSLSIYLADKLAIELIKFTNRDLYNIIYNKREFFISSDTHLLSSKLNWNTEKFNKKGKEFFDNLFQKTENLIYFPLLQAIFPYVKRYSRRQDLRTTYIVTRNLEYKAIEKNRRISSGKYFDLYFTSNINAYVKISILSEEVIGTFLSNLSFEEYLNVWGRLVQFGPNEQREVFDQLHVRVDDIPQKSIIMFIKTLFFKINDINDNLMFLSGNAKSRSEIIISDLLLKVPYHEFKDITKSWAAEYDKLHAIRSIRYWLDKSNEPDEEKTNEITNIYKLMVNNIIDNEINLYSDPYYYPNNILSLYYNLKQTDREALFKEYIEKLLNVNSVFRVLYDIINLSVGTDVRYTFSKGNMEIFTSEEKIDQILEQREAHTDDEKFVLEVYQVFKKDLKDEDWGDGGVGTERQYNLKL